MKPSFLKTTIYGACAGIALSGIALAIVIPWQGMALLTLAIFTGGCAALIMEKNND